MGAGVLLGVSVGSVSVGAALRGDLGLVLLMSLGVLVRK